MFTDMVNFSRLAFHPKKPSHAVDCCLAALNILSLMKKMRDKERIVQGLDLNNWSIRIGIHIATSGRNQIKTATEDTAVTERFF